MGHDVKSLKQLTRALMTGATMLTMPLVVAGCVQTPDGGFAMTDAGAACAAAVESGSARAVEAAMGQFPSDPCIADMLAALPSRVLVDVSPAAVKALPKSTLARVPPSVLAQLQVSKPRAAPSSDLFIRRGNSRY